MKGIFILLKDNIYVTKYLDVPSINAEVYANHSFSTSINRGAIKTSLNAFGKQSISSFSCFLL